MFLEPCNAVISVLRVQIYGKFFIPAKLLHKKIKKIIFAPMKGVRVIVVTALFTLIYGVSGAQINFFEISHDFGEIAEDGGSVEYVFTFRNTSAKPIVILSTHSSCGCTKAEFSRKPVMPDSTATVKVVFNPMNYPGVFARKITVVTDNGVLKDRLLVTGKVIPRKKSIEERYPIIMGGGVRAAANSHSFGYVEHGKMEQSTFELYNGSDKSVALAIENPHSELEFYLPKHIRAGEEVAVNFSCLLPENSTKYGTISYSVWLIVNGQKTQYPFILNGLAIDAREENANNRSQMIAMSENFIKFGAVKCDIAKLSHCVEVRNDGDKAIEIRKIEIAKEGFSADIEGDSKIEAGGRRKIKVDIYPPQLPYGAVVERLRIVSNDPKMPVMTIRVSAIVER